MSWRRARGDVAEAAVAAHLARAGLRLVERNVACRWGEIDLVLEDGEVLVFAEVRYRAGDDFGGGAASVDARKQARLAAAARWYLGRHPERADQPCRFDVIAVRAEPPFRIDWIRDAFQTA